MQRFGTWPSSVDGADGPDGGHALTTTTACCNNAAEAAPPDLERCKLGYGWFDAASACGCGGWAYFIGVGVRRAV